MKIRGGDDDEDDQEKEDYNDDDDDDEEEEDHNESAEDDEEEEEADDDDEEDEDEELESTLGTIDVSGVMNRALEMTRNTVVPYSQKVFKVVTKATVKLAKGYYRAVKRAVAAGFEESDDEPKTMLELLEHKIGRMVQAFFAFGSSEDDNDESIVDDEFDGEDSIATTTPKAKPSTIVSDFGVFLSKSYGVEDLRKTSSEDEDEDEEDSPPKVPIMGGSLTSALQEARAQARLLVVYLPVSKPNKNAISKDHVAIQSLLSAEVNQAAEKKPRKKGEDTGSFLVWGAKTGSSEATQAIKRLKAKTISNKGEKRPILMVVYPAMAISSGMPKVVPKVVAQHHCSPPPSASVMAAWLNALRKRHTKQYQEMQTELKELQYYKERKDGYKESQANDFQREKEEAEAEAKQREKEAEAAARAEALEARRKELLDNLPEEVPANTPNVKKVTLRFSDGQSTQRRFSPEQTVEDMFNWIDATFELQREIVVLTTLNGKITLTWDDQEKTLEETGLGKNTGFRVSQKEEEEPQMEEAS